MKSVPFFQQQSSAEQFSTRKNDVWTAAVLGRSIRVLSLQYTRSDPTIRCCTRPAASSAVTTTPMNTCTWTLCCSGRSSRTAAKARLPSNAMHATNATQRKAFYVLFDVTEGGDAKKYAAVRSLRNGQNTTIEAGSLPALRVLRALLWMKTRL